MGAMLLMAPLAVDAQHGDRVHRVGLVSAGNDPSNLIPWSTFLETMRELGYVEGKNLVVERAFAGGKNELLPGLVAELVRKKVDVIVVSGNRETRAAMQATNTIPIVMTVASDPVGEGFVASLARPGGNVTGTLSSVPRLSEKYVQLLREVVPAARHVGVVVSPPSPIAAVRADLEGAARSVGMTLSFAQVRGRAQLEPTLERLKKEGVGAIILPLDAVTLLHRTEIARLAVKHHLPSVGGMREYADDGALMSYGASYSSLRRRAAVLVDKIIKGQKPATLSIEQPTKFELVINLRTAKALGIAVPQSLLVVADAVVE